MAPQTAASERIDSTHVQGIDWEELDEHEIGEIGVNTNHLECQLGLNVGVDRSAVAGARPRQIARDVEQNSHHFCASETESAVPT